MKKYINQLCGVMESKGIDNSENSIILVDAIAEVIIDDVEYQIQIKLEPNKQKWLDPNNGAIIKITIE